MSEPINIKQATFLYESLHGEKPPKGFFNKGDVSKLTHGQLVTLGARWLRYEKNCSIVIEEPATAGFVKPDVMGFQIYSSMMIEVKVSKNDFLADKKKKGYNQKLADYNYYLVPADLIKPEEVRENWGLIYARSGKWKDFQVVKEPKYCDKSVNEWVHKVIFHSLLVKNNIKGHFMSNGEKR